MKALLNSLARMRVKRSSRRGQTLAEYALVISVLSIVAVGIYALIDLEIAGVFSGIANILDTAQSSH